MKQISLSNNTIKDRIGHFLDVKAQVVKKIQRSPFFAIQLDESVAVAPCPQLLVFARYVVESLVEEDFLFCNPLETTTKAEDIMEMVNSFFEEEKITWNTLVGVCTNGAPPMLGSSSGYATLVKRKYPAVMKTICAYSF